MFSKSKVNDPIEPKADKGSADKGPAPKAPGAPATAPGDGQAPTTVTAKPKAPPSLISPNLTITGNVQTDGDVQIEGTVEGDIRAHLLTVGETAVIRGEVLADDIVVHGRVVGRIRGIKVRLTASAKVEGDVIHKTIAIESGAQFEGSVSRNEDPLGDNAKPRQIPGPNGAGKSGGKSDV